MRIEYKTVGAPERCKRRKGAKTRSDRVAAAVQDILTAEAKDGWTYLRTDLIPVEESSGWFGRAREVHRAVMIFQRVEEDGFASQSGYPIRTARQPGPPVSSLEARIPAAPPLPESAPAARFEAETPAMPTTRAEPTVSPRPAEPQKSAPQDAPSEPGESAQPAMKITRAMGLHPGSMKSSRVSEDE